MPPSSPSARPIRVLLVSGPAAGGIRRHLEALARSLPERGFEVALAAPESLVVAAELPRFRVAVEDRPRPLAGAAAIRELRRAVRGWRPEIVHAHGVKAALLTLALPLPGGPAVGVTFHNLAPRGPILPALRLLLPRAEFLVAVSEAVRASLAASGLPAGRVRVIRHGVELPPPAALPAGESFVAGFAGRLTEEKGVRVLLRAAALLAGEQGVRLALAGDGPLRADVEAAARASGGRVAYLGERSDLAPFYRAAHLILVPSLSEGFSLVALEAMAAGRAVLASRVGGLPEVVAEGETGLLVPPADPEALAAAVGRLARDPARAAAMGAAGRKRADALFSRERMIDSLCEAYRAALPARWGGEGRSGSGRP